VKTLLDVRGLANTSDAFKRQLIEVAETLRLNPDFLAAVMSFESAGTFSPSIRNKFSGATGLIQFMPSTATLLGTTTDKLSKMTAEQQLDYVKEYYERVLGGRTITTLADHYLAVFAPAFIGKGPDAVTYAAPSKAYEQNKGLDKAGKGFITVADTTAPVQSIVDGASARPRLTVSDPVAVAKAGGIGAAVIAFFTGLVLLFRGSRKA
jgi:hypothetical protein